MHFNKLYKFQRTFPRKSDLKIGTKVLISSTQGGRFGDKNSLRLDPDYVLEESNMTDEKTVSAESSDYTLEESDMTDEKNVSSESSALTINVGDLTPQNIEIKGKIPSFSYKINYKIFKFARVKNNRG